MHFVENKKWQYPNMGTALESQYQRLQKLSLYGCRLSQMRSARKVFFPSASPFTHSPTNPYDAKMKSLRWIQISDSQGRDFFKWNELMTAFSKSLRYLTCLSVPSLPSCYQCTNRFLLFIRYMHCFTLKSNHCLASLCLGMAHASWNI